jgi:L-2-hydroxycarboxylate dehydrogenase (NAD+)
MGFGPIRHQSPIVNSAPSFAVERVRADIKASPTLPGFDEVRLPGERTSRIREERATAGIPIHAQLDAALSKVAGELGVVPL